MTFGNNNSSNSLEGFSENAKRILGNQSNSRVGAAHFIAMQDEYKAQTNPNGFISLGIAENTLCFDVLKDKLMSNENFNQRLTQYSDLGGEINFRRAICSLLQDTISKYRPADTNLLIKTEEIVVSTGATPLLENSFNMFCNKSEICIIPSPFYPAFVYDASMRFSVKVEPSPMEVFDKDGQVIGFKIDLNDFNQIYEQNPGKVKMVLLCNPCNPTGHIMPKEEIIQVVNWCREKKIHLLMDEIYALSVFNHDENTVEFHSIYDILQGDLGEYVHLISGFSKDFCLNGYRAGYVYSQNKLVIKYLSSTSQFYTCSNITQSSITNILTDKPFLNHYIQTNQSRLKDAYDHAARCLKDGGIPFIESSSGLFLMVDLRKCLKNSTFDEEINLWNDIFDEARVVINPGVACKCKEPGFYRFIFSLNKDVVAKGVERLSKFYQSHSSNNNDRKD